RRCAAEVEAAERGKAARVKGVVNGRVVAGKAELRRERQHVAARVVGPFVEQHVLAGVEYGAGVLEAADDFFQFHLQEVAFGRQKGTVASVVGHGPLEAVHRVMANDLIELGNGTRTSVRYRHTWIADLDVFTAVRDGRGQIILDPLVTERHAAAGS